MVSEGSRVLVRWCQHESRCALVARESPARPHRSAGRRGCHAGAASTAELRSAPAPGGSGSRRLARGCHRSGTAGPTAAGQNQPGRRGAAGGDCRVHRRTRIAHAMHMQCRQVARQSKDEAAVAAGGDGFGEEAALNAARQNSRALKMYRDAGFPVACGQHELSGAVKPDARVAPPASGHGVDFRQAPRHRVDWTAPHV